MRFLVGLAFWCAASGFVAALLAAASRLALPPLPGRPQRSSRSTYSAQFDAVSGFVFIFAIDRAMEISIGIVSAGVVLALTDLGHSRRNFGTGCAGPVEREYVIGSPRVLQPQLQLRPVSSFFGAEISCDT